MRRPRGAHLTRGWQPGSWLAGRPSRSEDDKANLERVRRQLEELKSCVSISVNDARELQAVHLDNLGKSVMSFSNSVSNAQLLFTPALGRQRVLRKELLSLWRTRGEWEAPALAKGHDTQLLQRRARGVGWWPHFDERRRSDLNWALFHAKVCGGLVPLLRRRQVAGVEWAGGITLTTLAVRKKPGIGLAQGKVVEGDERSAAVRLEVDEASLSVVEHLRSTVNAKPALGPGCMLLLLPKEMTGEQVGLVHEAQWAVRMLCLTKKAYRWVVQVPGWAPDADEGLCLWRVVKSEETVRRWTLTLKKKAVRAPWRKRHAGGMLRADAELKRSLNAALSGGDGVWEGPRVRFYVVSQHVWLPVSSQIWGRLQEEEQKECEEIEKRVWVLPTCGKGADEFGNVMQLLSGRRQVEEIQCEPGRKPERL